MRLGYVMTDGKGMTDRVLTAAADALLADGLALAGAVQSNTNCTGRRHCDMDVRVLPDGPVFRISQSLGEGARGCRLDPGALEQTVAAVEAALPVAAALIVNKFGKQEAAGRGFRPVIAEALALGLPVVVGINGLNLPAFLEFVGGAAEAIGPDPDAVADWLRRSAGDAASAA